MTDLLNSFIDLNSRQLQNSYCGKKINVATLLKCSPNYIVDILYYRYLPHNTLSDTDLKQLENVIFTDLQASLKYCQWFKKPLPNTLLCEAFNMGGNESYFASMHSQDTIYSTYLLRWCNDDPYSLVAHAITFLRKRWYAAEPYIINHVNNAIEYMIYFQIKSWPELQNNIINEMNVTLSYDMFERYLLHVYPNDRWPEAESTILKCKEEIINVYLKHLRKNKII